MGPPGGPGTYVTSLAALRALNATVFTEGYPANVMGYAVPADGGGGVFQYDPVSVLDDDDGIVVEPANGIGRWIRQFTGPISPLWFGMGLESGDAGTNKAVMARIYSYAAANPGTIIQLPDSPIYFEPNVDTVTMNVPSNTTIQGSSGSHVILTYGATEPATSGSFSLVDIFRISGRTNVRLSGFRITGSLTPSWLINSASVPIYTSTNVTLEDLYISQSQVDGIYIKCALNANIKASNVFVTNSQRSAMSITSGSVMQFNNCNFNASVTQDPWSGVNIETEDAAVTVADVQFNQCFFNGNVDSPNGAGLYIHRGNQPVDPTRIQINTCLFNGNGFGIRVDRASYVKISGACIFRNNVSADISLTRASYALVEGFDMQGASRGIYIINSQETLIQSGSILSASANAIEFIDNGSTLAEANLNNRILGVRIKVCGEIGIKLAGSDHTVRHCEISECQQQAIAEANLGLNNNIDANFCYENGLATNNTYAAIQTAGQTTTVTGNVVRKCAVSQSGTAQAGAAGTITLSADAPIRDDILNGFRVTILSGAGVGQTKFISDYDGTTKIASVTVNFSPAPDNTSVYEIVPAGNQQGYGIVINGTRNFVQGNDCLYAGATSNILDTGTQTMLRSNRTDVGPDNDASGSITAAFVCGTSGTVTINPANNTLRYVKIGKAVHVTGFVSVSAVSSPLGTLSITGLPFACGSGNSSAPGFAVWANNLEVAAITAMQGIVLPGTSAVLVQRYEAGSNAVGAPLMKATSELAFDFVYFTD